MSAARNARAGLRLAVLVLSLAGVPAPAQEAVAPPVEKVAPGPDQTSGAALRESGARDLDAAVARLGGGTDVNTAAASAVAPSVWGLADFGSYLVVIDGVPWGGAFTPAVSRVNLADVATIDVQVAGAPVLYGTTSFAGVVHVNRYAPADTPTVLQASVGSYGSAALGFSGALAPIGSYTQSLSVDVNRDQLSGTDHGLDDAHALYRGVSPLAGGWLKLDAEVEAETRHAESPVLRLGTGLVATPLDANYQPADARVGSHRFQGGVDYRHESPLGPLEMLASFASANVADRRGFLRASLTDDGSPNADGFNQERAIHSWYVDAHARSTLSESLALGWGADWTGGWAAQSSQGFEYYVPLDASRRAPPSSAVPVLDTTGFTDARRDAGAYAQADWLPDALTAGSLSLRLSRNAETRTSSLAVTAAPVAPAAASDAATRTRLSGGLALSRRFWTVADDKGEPAGGVEGRLSFRQTSPPPTPDFGPDYTPHLLKPMQGRRSDASLRGAALKERLQWTVEASYLDIDDLIVSQADVAGNPVLANAGRAHVRSVDLGTHWLLSRDRPLSADLSAGLHRASFGGTHSLEEGTDTDLVGRDLTLAPRRVAAAGIDYAPASGAYGRLSLAYFGPRFLDRLNTARAGGYATLDAKLGWRTARGGVWLHAANLTDRRVPVAESEFGDQAFYLSPARAFALQAYVNWR